MRNDTNIINGILVYSEGYKHGAVGLKDGIISQICSCEKELSPSDNIIDAKNILLFPGGIDSHIHIRGGEFSYREDFASATRAAASAGITTLLEMPGAAKPATTLENFMQKVFEIRRTSCLDIALYGGAGGDNLEEIPKMNQAGAIGFKTFLMPPVPGREKEFYGLCAENDETLEKIMSCVAKTGKTLTIHCEDNDIIEAKTKKIRQSGINTAKAFCNSRPIEAEIKAVEKAVRAAKKTGCKIIIAHVSATESVKLINDAKKQGINIHGETCAHYLSFDSDSVDNYGVFARLKPPFRDRSCVDLLVKDYENGLLEITGSDHAPFTKAEKLRNGNDIWNTVDGLPGLELTFPLLLKLVEEQKITYKTIARNFAENTAILFGLDQTKGRLEPGRDADIVFVRPLEVAEAIDIRNLHTKAKASAVIYDGLKIAHKVIHTIARGQTVYQDGVLHLLPGQGRFLTRK